jgi:hypothetical protein
VPLGLLVFAGSLAWLYSAKTRKEAAAPLS